MQSRYVQHSMRVLAVLLLSILPTVASAQSIETLRIASYNMEADINGATTPLPGFYQVLEGIGEEDVGGNVQPIDVLALQETTSNNTTVTPIVSALNTYYGAGTYAMSTYQATQNGGNSSGNGPNALVYNTKTLQLVASVGVGTPGGSSNGEYRQVVRYQLRPVGGLSADDFYVYVSHYKSGTGTSNATARNGEATIIRNDEAANLPATARVLYVGDYNFGNSTEQTYQTLTTVNSPSPNSKPQGAGVDIYNPPDQSGNVNYTIDWDNSSNLNKLSESATNLRYRDDYQLMTSNVYAGTAGGLSYIPGSYHIFGNNGSVSYNGNITSSSTVLKNLLLRGDLNLDGTVNSADLQQMLSALSDINGYQSSHAIASHALSAADFLAVADVNRDGVVSNADLQALLFELKNPSALNAAVPRSIVEPDLATASDHLPVVADYSVSISGGGSLAPVPEPSSLALLALGALTLWRFVLQTNPDPDKPKIKSSSFSNRVLISTARCAPERGVTQAIDIDNLVLKI
jgi:endonuclease/exonuclease/phosphatase family metal-dependent hydrolase